MLGPDRVIERRDGYLVARSPGNPTFYWGNFLLFDREPAPGDAPRWEALFDEEFGDEPRVRHRAFGWDRTDGEPGAVHQEFGPRGYSIEQMAGLVAERLVPHPRASADVLVRPLDPAADEELWDAVVELQVETREEWHDETPLPRLHPRVVLRPPGALPGGSRRAGTSPSTRRPAPSPAAAASS